MKTACNGWRKGYPKTFIRFLDSLGSYLVGIEWMIRRDTWMSGINRFMLALISAHDVWSSFISFIQQSLPSDPRHDWYSCNIKEEPLLIDSLIFSLASKLLKKRKERKCIILWFEEMSFRSRHKIQAIIN